MENLNIEKFNPTIAELTSLSTKYQGLTIAGVEDKDGYAAVDAARKELKKVRVQIQKTGKEMRSEALAFQKAVIAKEDEYVAMIEPLEKELAAKQKAIDDEQEKLDRVKLLPVRRKRLADYHLIEDDEVLLSMDSMQFDTYANQKIAAVLAEREKELAEKERKLAEEGRIAEENARREREVEEARVRATREAEERAEREKQAEIDRLQREKEEVEAKRIKAEKNKRYQKWTTGLDINLAIGDKIERVGDTFIAYRKVGEITIK